MSPTDIHPVADRLTFDAIEIGQEFEVERAFSRQDVLAFAALSGDFSPLHVDATYAASTEFGDCVVHGVLLASLFSQLVGMRIPGERALYLGQDLAFRRPVLVDESVRAMVRVAGKSAATRTLSLATEIRGVDGKLAVTGTAKVRVRETGSIPVAPAGSVEPQLAPHGSTKQVAIVTGGSGGIGAEIVRALARRGYAVAVNYHQREDKAAAVVASVESSNGIARSFQADVRDPVSVERLVKDVRGTFGTPTILVNTAIGDLEQRPFAQLDWSDFQSHIEYQVKAVFNLSRMVYPLMKEAGGGVLVNVLSQVVAGAPPAHMADYVVAKYALEGLSKALAAEWAGEGIRVNMVSPGLTRTELTEFHHERVFKAESVRTPLRRLATVDDIAHAVAYLVSEEAAFLTGINLFVTGGQVMA
jgi:3-oxoacyl-[acyl-carrier protein] reductase